MEGYGGYWGIRAMGVMGLLGALEVMGGTGGYWWLRAAAGRPQGTLGAMGDTGGYWWALGGHPCGTGLEAGEHRGRGGLRRSGTSGSPPRMGGGLSALVRGRAPPGAAAPRRRRHPSAVALAAPGAAAVARRSPPGPPSRPVLCRPRSPRCPAGIPPSCFPRRRGKRGAGGGAASAADRSTHPRASEDEPHETTAAAGDRTRRAPPGSGGGRGRPLPLPHARTRLPRGSRAFPGELRNVRARARTENPRRRRSAAPAAGWRGSDRPAAPLRGGPARRRIGAGLGGRRAQLRRRGTRHNPLIAPPEVARGTRPHPSVGACSGGASASAARPVGGVGGVRRGAPTPHPLSLSVPWRRAVPGGSGTGKPAPRPGPLPPSAGGAPPSARDAGRRSEQRRVARATRSR